MSAPPAWMETETNNDETPTNAPPPATSTGDVADAPPPATQSSATDTVVNMKLPKALRSSLGSGPGDAHGITSKKRERKPTAR